MRGVAVKKIEKECIGIKKKAPADGWCFMYRANALAITS